MRTGLGTKQQLPKVLAERRRVFVEEPGELDLERFDVGVTATFNQVEDKLDDHIVFIS